MLRSHILDHKVATSHNTCRASPLLRDDPSDATLPHRGTIDMKRAFHNKLRASYTRVGNACILQKWTKRNTKINDKVISDKFFKHSSLSNENPKELVYHISKHHTIYSRLPIAWWYVVRWLQIFWCENFRCRGCLRSVHLGAPLASHHILHSLCLLSGRKACVWHDSQDLASWCWWKKKKRVIFTNQYQW